LCAGFCVAGLVGQVRGNDPVDDSQHFAQNHGLTGRGCVKTKPTI
jgi:hypothetical protein